MIQQVTIPKGSEEVSVAFYTLLKELNIEESELSQDAVEGLLSSIRRNVKVKNSALLYLTCDSSRAETMKARLVRDVMNLFERGY